MDAEAHWEGIYHRKELTELSWQEPEAGLSLGLIRELVPDHATPIIDIGGGASPLVDGLLDVGYQNITVLDIAPSALAQTRERLGRERAARVAWLSGDLLTIPLAAARYGLWHDRAVFHFLTDPESRAKYIALVRRAVRPAGLVLIATFAEDGPTRCSGLPVVRYSPKELQTTFGEGFTLLRELREVHRTPWNAPQPFTYCVFRVAPS